MDLRAACLGLLGLGLVAASAANCGSDGDTSAATLPDAGNAVDAAVDGLSPSPDGAPTPSPFGLDVRPANTTCKAPARPPILAGGAIAFEAAFPNMDFNGFAITVLRSRLGASGPMRWFVVERDGDVWTFVDSRASKDALAADGTTAVEKAELFLHLPTAVSASGEGGLLGAALDPDFGLRDDANVIYLHYTVNGDPALNHVERFRVARQNNAWAIVDSKRVFTTGSGGSNHWGGALDFGPDGYLYISLGDGGNGYFSPDAQKLSWLRGKIVRIDPRSAPAAAPAGQAFVIPETNPYRLSAPQTPTSPPNTPCSSLTRAQLEARTAACPEIFARGFRNPWRMSFDKETNQLWVADVGTGKEELNLVLLGQNYGWTLCDGINPTGSCPPKKTGTSFIAPVAQYRQGSYVSIVGGYVYRGTALGAGLRGAYIFTNITGTDLYIVDKPYEHATFAPFSIGNTFEHPLDATAAGLPAFRVTTRPDGQLPAFAQDENNELYAVYFASGKGRSVFKLVPPSNTPPPPDTIPERLSQTGCFEASDPTKVAAGVIPYDINAAFWSDGAEKTRYLAIPDGKTIHIGADGDWELPNESVLIKSFRVAGKLVETRLLVRHTDGDWAGYTYVWSDDQKDAVKANPAGETRLYGTQSWRFPSRSGCMDCHTAGAGRSLGLETRQINRETVYPSTNRRANQIDTLAHVGMFDQAPPASSTLPAFADPFGAADLETRARVYLHTNCAQCHRAPGQRPHLTFETPLATTKLCDAPALVTPGNPATSTLIQQMRDPDRTTRMPRAAGFLLDERGVKLVEDWIQSKTSCP